ncbi:MAG: hypothetical protein M3545_05855 [Acidobacteriota bacterium]|nr:hypothetical protein [Acidobacteriota bacterium]
MPVLIDDEDVLIGAASKRLAALPSRCELSPASRRARRSARCHWFARTRVGHSTQQEQLT